MEKRRAKQGIEEEMVLVYVRGIRAAQPRMGTRKLYALLRTVIQENGIKMGRDKFYHVLGEHGLLVRPRRRHRVTTDSSHAYRKYPNLIKGREPGGPEQVWASDITYVPMGKEFAYVSLVTDQYSKRIMGFQVHETLEAEGPLRAMRMALKNRTHRETRLIHHSDQGIQYCCEEYVTLLKRNGISISMSAPGNPYENAIAERVNGVLKTEFYLDSHFETIAQVRKAAWEAIFLYNHHRPHASCDYMTPYQAHQQSGPLKKRWRTYPRKKRPYKHRISEETRKAIDQLLMKADRSGAS